MSDEQYIGVNDCELCREWVEEPQMVCEYRGRRGYLVITSEGWPDRKPVKPSPHKLAEAIKALQYYATHAEHAFVAKDALAIILKEEDE